MKIRDVNHDLKTTLWCGPAALSAITGRPTSEIHRVFKNIRCSERPVQGVTNRELVECAKRLGLELEPIYDWFVECKQKPIGVPTPKKPTLATLVRTHREHLKLPVIVNVTGHYVTVQGRSFLDTFTGGKVVRLKTAPGRRCRVKRAWKVKPVAQYPE